MEHDTTRHLNLVRSLLSCGLLFCSNDSKQKNSDGLPGTVPGPGAAAAVAAAAAAAAGGGGGGGGANAGAGADHAGVFPGFGGGASLAGDANEAARFVMSLWMLVLVLVLLRGGGVTGV